MGNLLAQLSVQPNHQFPREPFPDLPSSPAACKDISISPATKSRVKGVFAQRIKEVNMLREYPYWLPIQRCQISFYIEKLKSSAQEFMSFTMTGNLFSAEAICLDYDKYRIVRDIKNVLDFEQHNDPPDLNWVGDQLVLQVTEIYQGCKQLFLNTKYWNSLDPDFSSKFYFDKKKFQQQLDEEVFVGLEVEVNNLLKKLVCITKKQLQVVSIVGMAGLGLPYYNPGLKKKADLLMSSKSILSSLKKIGGVHNPKLKVVAEKSGSESLPEGGSENVAPVSGNRGGQEHPPPSDPIVEVSDAEELDVRSRRKRLRKSSEKAIDLRDGSNPEGTPSGPDSVRVGNYSIKEVGKILSRFPGKDDWNRMSQSSQKDNLKELIGVWAQAGILMAGISSSCEKQEVHEEELHSARQIISEKDLEIQKLHDDLSALKLSHQETVSGLRDSLKKAEDRATAAESQSDLLIRDVNNLKADLKSRRPDVEVLEEFKKSAAYEEALSDAAASKIFRTWLVAERYIKTTPDSNWDDFVELYAAAEESVENSGEEPVPYSGPNPIIPQQEARDEGNPA